MAIRLAGLLLVGALCGAWPHPALAQSADPMEGRIVREIRVGGLQRLSSDVVERHLATRVGGPFHRATMAVDQRQLDELRLFTAVRLEPRLENEAVILDVTVTETLKLLPVVILRVTDENGVSAGPGMRGINLLGGGTQSSVAVRFGGETGVSATVDATTVTPGTWVRHLGFNFSARENTLYDFDERATSVDARFARNWNRGVRTGVTGELLSIDTGSSGASLSADGTDIIPTLGAFLTVDTLDSSTNPRAGSWAEVQVDRLLGDAQSWTFVLDGRRFQRLSDRHGLGLFALATLAERHARHGLAGVSPVRFGRCQHGARVESGRAHRAKPIHWHLQVPATCCNLSERSLSRV